MGLQAADDQALWDYAATNGFAIVSKDADYHQRSLLYGHPPKIVWIRRGNCSTADIEAILRDHHGDVVAFDRDSQASFLALS